MNSFHSSGLIRDVDVVIVGGGPAGCATAIALKSQPATADREVVIIERDTFPRYKVCGCCLNGAAATVFDALGIEDLFSQTTAISLNKWTASFRGRMVSVDLPTGWALSRGRLDSFLLRRAGSLGVEVIQPARAKILSVETENVSVMVQPQASSSQMLRARNVIVASGLGAQVPEPWLPWRNVPRGPIGVGAVVPAGCGGFEPGVIYMAIGATGYVGAVQLEDGQIDLAAAIYAPQRSATGVSCGEQVELLLKNSGFGWKGCDEPIRWQGTPQLTRQRLAGQGRLLAVGDAAGYIEPFTGEGMAWGLRTGVIAAQAIARTESKRDAAGEIYRRLYDKQLSKRRIPCRLLTKTLQYGVPRNLLFGSLRMAPWIASPMVRWMNRHPISS